jgi:hypothetical protein
VIIRGVPTFLVLIAAVLAAVAVYGCGDDAGSSLEGEVRYVRSGGIAGKQETLVVQPDGRATHQRHDVQDAFELTDDELSGLADELERFEVREDLAPRPAPDAFTYVVDYGGRTARADDPSLSKSPLKPLVVRLEKIIEAQR